jgi:hypothetical protein
MFGPGAGLEMVKVNFCLVSGVVPIAIAAIAAVTPSPFPAIATVSATARAITAITKA